MVKFVQNVALELHLTILVNALSLMFNANNMIKYLATVKHVILVIL